MKKFNYKKWKSKHILKEQEETTVTYLGCSFCPEDNLYYGGMQRYTPLIPFTLNLDDIQNNDDGWSDSFVLTFDEYIPGFESIGYLHDYMFEDEASLNNLITNIDRNLKIGGYLIGTTFDGASVLEQLRARNPLEGKNEGDETMWIIEYTDGELPEIDAINYSSKITTTLPWIHNKPMEEFLVNFNLLQEKLAERNIRLVKSETFEHYYNAQPSGSRPPVLKPYEQLYSFMNRYFIFQKNVAGGEEEAKSVE